MHEVLESKVGKVDVDEFTEATHPLIQIHIPPFLVSKFQQMIYSWLLLEKILKGSLDSIPSPSHSLKIQIMGGKVCLRCKGKTLPGVVNKLLPYYLK